MRIRSAHDLALHVRDRRRDLGLTQARLAEAAGVSRRWLSALESGKATAEVGLVLKILDALGLIVDIGPPRGRRDGVDLDDILREHGREDR